MSRKSDSPIEDENAVRRAIDKLHGPARTVLALWDRFQLQVSIATLHRAQRMGKIIDSDLLFSLATLTGESPWELAGRKAPTPSPDPQHKRPRSARLSPWLSRQGAAKPDAAESVASQSRAA